MTDCLVVPVGRESGLSCALWCVASEVECLIDRLVVTRIEKVRGVAKVAVSR